MFNIRKLFILYDMYQAILYYVLNQILNQMFYHKTI